MWIRIPHLCPNFTTGQDLQNLCLVLKWVDFWLKNPAIRSTSNFIQLPFFFRLLPTSERQETTQLNDNQLNYVVIAGLPEKPWSCKTGRL